MCTLTYRLTAQGYQLFFNRDEQRTRPQAVPPTIDEALQSAYPIDPTGGGTWIAVHQSGVSLALLNYYQAQVKSGLKTFISRGVIIPKLLLDSENIHNALLNMDLSVFQSFNLCVFGCNLSAKKGQEEQATQYIWNGQDLTFSTLKVLDSQPITSSSVDFETVYAYRKQQFNNMINTQATMADYLAYHQHQGESGKCSVNMFREDAKTVSFTQISVDQNQVLGQKVNIEYLDYLIPQPLNATARLIL